MIASDDIKEFSVMESDIKVYNSSIENELVIDMVIAFMKSDDKEPNVCMNVSYASCLSIIRNATKRT